MVIQHNLAAMFSQKEYEKNNGKLAKSLEKLSSGYSINRAGDNAAGLAVSEKMRSQIFGIKQSVKNCADGVSLVQTFEGALGQTVAIIRRARDLAVQSANGTYQDEVDREAIQIEYLQLCDEVDQIADTDFNGLCMLNGRKMADKFTFLTEEGTKWLTPSKAEFPKESVVSTFKKVEGFPEIEMSIELLPDAKEKIISDKELMQALDKLNSASVKSFYDQGIPKFSLEGLGDEDRAKFTIETTGSEAIISTYTAQSGKVDVARVSCTDLPHYASTSATGKWRSSSVVTCSTVNPNPKADTPGNDRFDVTKFTENYVNQGSSAGVTRAERQTYLDWIDATPRSRVSLVSDDDFNEDTDPLKFTWSLNGQEYENVVGSDGKPTSSSGVSLPVYADDYSGGPQIYIDNFRFMYDDEDMKAGAYWQLSVSSRYSSVSGSYDGKSIYCGTTSFNNNRYTEIWLDYGRQNVTLTYNKADGKWYDNFGGSGDNGTYGINPKVYADDDRYGRYVTNLERFYEADGTPPDGLKLSVSVTCPRSRSSWQGGYVYQQNSVHNDKSINYSNLDIIDFRMDEIDPAHPELGGVDYSIAKDGATYTFDGRTQPDGSIGVWRDAEGNAVNLEDEGVYLPSNPDSTDILKLHDGMSITVHNPTMVGEDYIKADIRLFDDDRSVNYFRRIYDNMTYSDNLIIQAGARTKDSVNFTFAYSSDGLGELEADLNCTAIGLGMEKLSLATQEKANYAIDKLDNALNKVSMIRSTFGSIQNRLEHKIDDLNNTAENLTAAESRIRDTDMAKGMMEFTKNQILSQSSQAMIAQANTLPQNVLQTLQAGSGN